MIIRDLKIKYIFNDIIHHRINCDHNFDLSKLLEKEHNLSEQENIENALIHKILNFSLQPGFYNIFHAFTKLIFQKYVGY